MRNKSSIFLSSTAASDWEWVYWPGPDPNLYAHVNWDTFTAKPVVAVVPRVLSAARERKSRAFVMCLTYTSPGSGWAGKNTMRNCFQTVTSFVSRLLMISRFQIERDVEMMCWCFDDTLWVCWDCGAAHHWLHWLGQCLGLCILRSVLCWERRAQIRLSEREHLLAFHILHSNELSFDQWQMCLNWNDSPWHNESVIESTKTPQ